MATITVHIDEKLKKSVAKTAKKQGITLTFLVNQLFKAYQEDRVGFGVITYDDEIESLSRELDVLAKKKLKGKKFPPLEDQLVDL